MTKHESFWQKILSVLGITTVSQVLSLILFSSLLFYNFSVVTDFIVRKDRNISSALNITQRILRRNSPVNRNILPTRLQVGFGAERLKKSIAPIRKTKGYELPITILQIIIISPFVKHIILINFYNPIITLNNDNVVQFFDRRNMSIYAKI